jgi:Ca2+-binding RTX toxin-like protein
MLVVKGTAKGDMIGFKQGKKGRIEVRLGSRKLGVFSEITRIVVEGGAGNDLIDASASRVPVVLFGGSGNDRLVGSKFSDILIGGDGNDRLFGNRGNDLIVGGAGKDDLHSVFGKDLLVGGSVAFENDLSALSAALSAWMSSGQAIGSTAITDDRVRDILYGTPGVDALLAGVGDKVVKLKHRN